MASSETHGLRRLVIAVIVLVVVLVAIDRIALVVAERAAGSSIEQSEGLPSRPDVDVHGFPFLTQLAASSYGDITVTANNVPVGKQPNLLTISSIRIELHHVDTSRNFSRIHAASATATARVSLTSLGKALGITLAYAGDGRVRASKAFTIDGHTFTPTITTSPALQDGALAFTSAAVDGAGGAGADVTSALRNIFGVTIPLTSIPFNIRVQHLALGKDGLVLSLAGSDLTYDEGQ